MEGISNKQRARRSKVANSSPSSGKKRKNIDDIIDQNVATQPDLNKETNKTKRRHTNYDTVENKRELLRQVELYKNGQEINEATLFIPEATLRRHAKRDDDNVGVTKVKSLTTKDQQSFLEETCRLRDSNNNGMTRKQMIALISDVTGSTNFKTCENHYDYLIRQKRLPELKYDGKPQKHKRSKEYWDSKVVLLDEYKPPETRGRVRTEHENYLILMSLKMLLKVYLRGIDKNNVKAVTAIKWGTLEKVVSSELHISEKNVVKIRKEFFKDDDDIWNNDEDVNEDVGEETVEDNDELQTTNDSHQRHVANVQYTGF